MRTTMRDATLLVWPMQSYLGSICDILRKEWLSHCISQRCHGSPTFRFALKSKGMAQQNKKNTPQPPRTTPQPLHNHREPLQNHSACLKGLCATIRPYTRDSTVEPAPPLADGLSHE